MTKYRKSEQDNEPVTEEEMESGKVAITDFQKRCYMEIQRIPPGCVSTYGAVAKALDPPSSARAVGGALRSNPFAPRVPCHRVVASNLDVGGYFGQWGQGTSKVS
eukprot:m.332768 g.332768  ORF g.332768 m.332768 type:complete len:105 (+) comp20494_c0_seq16:251-565(+)